MLPKFSLSFIFVSFLVAINARSLSLSQKELRSVGSALSTSLRNHVKNDVSFKFFGVFTIESTAENPDDFDITLDLDVSSSETNNGVLSGKFIVKP